MADPVRARRLTEDEGRRLQQIVRRQTGSPIRLRRAMVIMASASGNTVPAIARLVQGDEDAIREVIHRFNDIGLACLDPQWAGGRPRRISEDDETFIVATARTTPQALDQPFTRWSLRKLCDYLAHNHGVHRVIVSRVRLREFLHQHKIRFQRTRTWKESNDPQIEAKLARIEHVTSTFPDRVFAFDEFGPTIRPHLGASWTEQGHPDRLPANYHKLHGVRQFHACYSVGDDTLWGVVRARKSAGNTLAALKSIRRSRPDGAPIYVILDNLSAHKGSNIRSRAARHNVELCFTPTYASWANPIEDHFGPLRTFVVAGSNYPNHPAATRALHKYLRWRNANARHPDVLAAQRRERARVRSERQHRWGHPAENAAEPTRPTFPVRALAPIAKARSAARDAQLCNGSKQGDVFMIELPTPEGGTSGEITRAVMTTARREQPLQSR
jgi:transposase